MQIATRIAAGGMLAAAALAGPSQTQPATEAVNLVSGRRPDGVLVFRIRDESGRSVPARLTFTTADRRAPELFDRVDASPQTLAVRRHVVYTRDGAGAIRVPVGRYAVLVSRGIEYELARATVEIRTDRPASLDVTLRQVVDTRGWISGDFHLHTRTYSGHGDANLLERVITLAGEGVEFAVATDHNHNTDYAPTVAQLGLGSLLSTVTGNEVSTPIGHFNVFPLDPRRRPPPYELHDAHELFRLLRSEPNAFGVVPVIQVNHPRWGRIDYFGRTGLDPVTGLPQTPRFSEDFDTIEVLNENEGWGYYDADAPGDHHPPTGAGRFSVLGDWFLLLNRGHLYAAVGNSDSHHVQYELAGYPRNFVRCEPDDPARLEVTQVVESLRRGEVFTTLGPFVEFWVDDQPMGSTVRTGAGRVTLRVRVQAASWIPVNRVRIVLDGDVVSEIPVPPADQPLRLDAQRTIPVESDAWICVLVEGDEPLGAVIPMQERPIYPLAVTNPIRIDADGQPGWTPPYEQARAAARALDARTLETRFRHARPSRRALLLLAAAELRHPHAGGLTALGLADRDRRVRLAAARAAEQLKTEAPIDAVRRAYALADGDAYARIALLRAWHAADADTARPAALAFMGQTAATTLQRYAGELLPLLPGGPVRSWEIVGYFPRPSRAQAIRQAYGPETDASPDAEYEGKGGRTVRWMRARLRADGFVDLRQIGPRGLDRNAVAYARTFLYSPDARRVPFALGTDDACRMWLNSELLYEDLAGHAANPFQHVGELALKPGWNQVLIKVENGGGAFGLYLLVFDDAVRSAARPTVE